MQWDVKEATEKNALSDFEKELINRFFDQKSYFLNGFFSFLKSEELADPLDSVAVGMIMDELIQSPDKTAKLRELSAYPRFKFYLDQFFQGIEFLKTARLSTQQMMDVVGNLGRSLAETLVELVKDPETRQQLLVSLQLIDPPPVHEEGTVTVESEPVVDLTQEFAALVAQDEEPGSSEPEPTIPLESEEITVSEFESEEGDPGQEAETEQDEWEFWSLFQNDRQEKIGKIRDNLAKLQKNPNDMKRFRKIKNDFRDLRDWSMIQGEQGVEAISHKILLLFETVYKKDLNARQVIIPVLNDAVDTLQQLTSFGFGNEQLDVAHIMAEQIDRARAIYPDPLPQQGQEPDAEAAAIVSVRPEVSETEESTGLSTQEAGEDSFDVPSFQEASLEDELAEAIANSLVEEQLQSDTEMDPLWEAQENFTEPEISEDTIPVESNDLAPEDESFFFPDSLLSEEEDDSKGVMEVHDLESIDEEEATLPLQQVPEEVGEVNEVEEEPTEEDPFGDIRDSELLSELLNEESPFTEESVEEEKSPGQADVDFENVVSIREDESDSFVLPGEDDEELQEILAQLQKEQVLTPVEGQGEMDDDVGIPEVSLENATEEIDQILTGEEEWEAWDDTPESVSETDDSLAESIEKNAGDGFDLIEEADMYFVFARKALQQLMKNASQRQALEDLELACYSLSTLGRKLGYVDVADILAYAEKMIQNAMNGERILATDSLNAIFSFYDELERAGRERKLNDAVHSQWIKETKQRFQSFLNKNSLKGGNGSHVSPASTTDEEGSDDPMNYLLFDDHANFSSQLREDSL